MQSASLRFLSQSKVAIKLAHVFVTLARRSLQTSTIYDLDLAA
jgi:hypothetical protein